MLLTQLHYFEALARERHFGRAAASCHVTTSTLSEAIRKLEGELKVPLVNRGRSAFRGLTPEGELVLEHARRMVGDHRMLLEDLSARQGQLETTVRLGVIPSGLNRGAAVLDNLCREHPGITVDLVAGLRSEEIITRLRSAELDAGVIHPAVGTATGGGAEDGAGTGGLHLIDLGTVEFVVLVSDELVSDRTEITGAELSSLPLAVLSPGMRTRAEFDRAMADAEVELTPAAEADSVEALLALAATGRWAVVVPAESVGHVGEGMRVLTMTEPAVHLSVALARVDTHPVSALAAALDDATKRR